MGGARRVLVAPRPRASRLAPETALRRRRPRSYLEWKTLREWGRLPIWEDDPPGYLLRELRESAGISQRALAERLGCSQQAVAQAERWDANPTFGFAHRWARALGARLTVSFRTA